ncbi:hypothetical protein NDN08_001864 [Rhodosorus marinus]|uniref:Polynucleotide kinase n=1 Tax=Rhodosorus marinus TaxID=101924 RepID=A0AAV8UVR0_9RHOD|nr:hypothetical protein NDN08_001864 [Rhodosorus marinus]
MESYCVQQAFTELQSSPCPVQDSGKTLIVFDWDDTLLPSTFLTYGCGLRVSDDVPVPEDVGGRIDPVAEAAVEALSIAMQHGDVVIVTNAEHGWVEMSSDKFLPRINHFIRENGITVVSARSAFEEEIPDSPVDWKIGTFSQQVQSSDRKSYDNLVVIGDDECERLAGHAMSRIAPCLSIKTVKFVRKPEPSQLARQLGLLAQSLSDLCEEQGNHDVNFIV